LNKFPFVYAPGFIKRLEAHWGAMSVGHGGDRTERIITDAGEV